MSLSPRTPPAPPRAVSAVPVLAVDRTACTGHGVCATLLPEHITLDEWGYPILDGPIPKTADAELAVRYCPARALYWRNRNA